MYISNSKFDGTYCISTTINAIILESGANGNVFIESTVFYGSPNSNNTLFWDESDSNMTLTLDVVVRFNRYTGTVLRQSFCIFFSFNFLFIFAFSIFIVLAQKNKNREMNYTKQSHLVNILQDPNNPINYSSNNGS